MSAPRPNHQQRIAAIFNLVAPDYGHPALRFFVDCAERLVALADLQVGAHILDVGTGTGAAAIAAAHAIGKRGAVTGIDLAPDMLRLAHQHIQSAGLQNIDLIEMDAAHPQFAPSSFDAVLCALAVFLMPDEVESLNNWQRLLRPGGVLGFSVFGEDAFQPLSELFVERLRKFGLDYPDTRHAFATQKITTPEQCRDLLAQAGLNEIDIRAEQRGYFLTDVLDWWHVVWGSGFRAPLNRIPPEQIESFRAAHLDDASELVTKDGLWIDIPIIFAFGRSPDK